MSSEPSHPRARGLTPVLLLVLTGVAADTRGAEGELKVTERMVATADGWEREVLLVAAGDTSKPGAVPSSPVLMAAVPGVQWSYNDPGYSIPNSVALSRVAGTAWVGQDFNTPRLQRFAIAGSGVPTDLVPANPSRVYTAAAQEADLAVRVVRTTTSQIIVHAFNSTSTSALWTFTFPANYTYVDELHTRVARSGKVVCCAGRQESPTTATRVYFLDGATGAALNQWDYAGSIAAVDTTDTGDLCLVTQSTNGRLINTATGTEIFTGTTSGGSWTGRISGNGTSFVLGGTHVKRYSRSGAGWFVSFDAVPSPAEYCKVGISRDGSTIASASTNSTFLTFRTRIYNWNGTVVGTYTATGTGSYQDSPVNVVLADDGSAVAVGSWGSQNNSHPEAMVFNRTGTLLGSVDTPGSVVSLDLSRDGVYMLVGSTPTHVNAGTSGGRVSLYQVRALPKILRVDAEVGAGGNGSTWASAYKYLQDALAASQVGDEIWIAQGIYQPDRGAGQTAGNRNSRFNMKTGIEMFGGFQGVTPAPPGFPNGETQRSQRNWQANETILSGDLANNDGPDFTNNSDNCMGVVGALRVAATTLDGFTIEAGNRIDQSQNGSGGGLLADSYATPTIRNCTFSRNMAASGGGVQVFSNSDGLFDNCTFTGNVAQYGGGAALVVQSYCSPTLQNCRFLGNQQLGTTSAGGAAFSWLSNPTYINCLFSGNRDRSHGGAMHILGGSAELINCTFAHNESYGGTSGGGGVHVSSASSLVAKNVIFWGNKDSVGINEASQIRNYGTTTINNSCVQGWSGALGGVGNQGQNPLFVDADGMDNVVGTEDDDLHLGSCSTARDGGNNAFVPAGITTDLDGVARILDSNVDSIMTVDMGCYESANVACQPMLYVKADAPAGGNGGSWATAFRDLQSALDVATSGNEIWVAAGTYKPSKRTDAGNARTVTFSLRSGVALYGGFAGTEAQRAQRNYALHASILNGDLNGDDFVGDYNYYENAYHVVTGSGTSSTAVLDGFTIRGGNADGGSSPHYDGGGMYSLGGTPTIRNCRFLMNRSQGEGGAIYNESSSNLTLVNCAIMANTASHGGGIYNWQSSPTIINCTITGNWQGISSAGGTPLVRNCIIWGNANGALADQISGGASVSYSCVQGWGSPGVDGNINSNPLMFEAPESYGDSANDVRLRAGSPCLDAGNNSYLPADASDLDGDGNTTEALPLDLGNVARAADHPCAPNSGVGTGGIVDMGAFERVPPAGTPAARLYVKKTAAGANTGLNWTDAFTDLQSALLLAYDNACVVDEIWVAAGTYQPTVGTDRTAAFVLGSGVAVYGGFAGTETTLGQRNTNPATNNAVLSGDIGAIGDISDNSNTVVNASFTDATCVLDAFTIRDGNANSSGGVGARSGGGIMVLTGSPTLGHCAIVSNQAIRYGAGIYIDEASSPTLTDCNISDNLLPVSATYGLGCGAYVHRDSHPVFTRCQFQNNAAPDKNGGGMMCRDSQTTVKLVDCVFRSNTAWFGAGLISDTDASLTLTRCQFIDNAVSTSLPNPSIPPLAGAMAVLGGTHRITNCQFIHNTSTGNGGAMVIGMANCQLTNCLFSRNSAVLSGGAVFAESDMNFANCTFSGNTAQGQGGVFGMSDSALTLVNSVLWGNTDSSGSGATSQFYLDPSYGPSTLAVSYSVVQDAVPGDASVFPGVGNVDRSPNFANAAADDLNLMNGSSAIDAGNNSLVPADVADLDGDANVAEQTPLDLSGKERLRDVLGVADTGVGPAPVVDMGALESQVRSVIAWRSVRPQIGGLSLAIPLNANASGNGSSGPGVESRSGGIQQIEATFDGPIMFGSAPVVSVVGRTTSGGVLGSPVSYVPNSVEIWASSVRITFAPGILPDQSCYTLTLSPDLITQGIAGDLDVNVRSLYGDATGDGWVNLSDALAIRARISTPVKDGAQFDINAGGNIDMSDALMAKSLVSSPPRRALCP